MNLAELITADGISIPAGGDTFEAVLGELLGLLPEDEALEDAARAKCARDLAVGSRGEVVRFHDEVVLVGVEIEGVEQPHLMLGVSSAEIVVTGEGRDEPAAARIIFLLIASRKISALRARVAPVLRRLVSDETVREALLEADSVDDVRHLEGFLDTVIPGKLLVETAVEPVTYRVYPDTPVKEILDLMARRQLHAVPVVGDQYEVLGIITAGDALGYLVPRARTGSRRDAANEGCARDIMTRSVLCVTEDQALLDVAAQMSNRDVEQLPVVREGELVGFITRDSVLRILFGPDEGQ